LVLLFVAMTSGMHAQEPPSKSRETSRLAYFVGRWQVESAPKGPGTSDTPTVSVHEYRWLEGTSFLMMRSLKSSRHDAPVQMAILSYDPRQREYTADFYAAPDVRVPMTGMVSGTSWTWLSRDGQLRETIQMLSPSTFTFHIARSRGTVGWLTLSEGKAVKIGEVPAAPEP
jgi:hypothetical protein